MRPALLQSRAGHEAGGGGGRPRDVRGHGEDGDGTGTRARQGRGGSEGRAGFLVNLQGRAYATEGLAIAQEGAADPATIDRIMRDGAGFRMAPFRAHGSDGHRREFRRDDVHLRGLSARSSAEDDDTARCCRMPACTAARPVGASTTIPMPSRRSRRLRLQRTRTLSYDQ
ncbi:3-hydroxyacyl-CoA dehydrogenase family protein [Sphingomonas sp. MMS24-JH45]